MTEVYRGTSPLFENPELVESNPILPYNDAVFEDHVGLDEERVHDYWKSDQREAGDWVTRSAAFGSKQTILARDGTSIRRGVR